MLEAGLRIALASLREPIVVPKIMLRLLIWGLGVFYAFEGLYKFMHNLLKQWETVGLPE